ncbi:MAG TPA: BON domain-containing protein [Candidatus Binataceae bacterium]|nr:BON domain-containing protein [Candidatus Binataceae bacterium]
MTTRSYFAPGRMAAYCLAAMLLGVLIAACAATKNTESTGNYVDDAVITTKVKAAIAGDPNLSALAIKVQTYRGVVQLSGWVDSTTAAERASKLASEVAGVKEVDNSLIVKNQGAGVSG